jgi:glycosyltransferase involved in cell wall biosynthesis
MPKTINSKFLTYRCIYWICLQPTPYNDYLFRNLDTQENIDLHVYFRDMILSSHPWKSELAQGYNAQGYQTFLGVDWNVISLPFRDPDAFYLIAGWNHLTSQILLSLLRIFGLKYALWTDTPNMDKKRTPLLSFLRSTWLKWIFDGATKILGTGEPGLANLKMMGAEQEKLVNFPFFLDLSSYQRNIIPRQYTTESPFKFVSSGRIQNYLKGHDIAIRALSVVAKSYKNVPFEYTIAGTGPDESELKKLAKELGINDKVKFLGWVEPQALKELYLNADALIHPSPIHDPFPNAVLEGMAAGLVVFGSDVSGSVTDRIKNGVNGFIHSAGNVDELSTQIIQLLSNVENVHKIATNARSKAEEWPIQYGINTIKSIVNSR